MITFWQLDLNTIAKTYIFEIADKNLNIIMDSGRKAQTVWWINDIKYWHNILRKGPSFWRWLGTCSPYPLPNYIHYLVYLCCHDCWRAHALCKLPFDDRVTAAGYTWIKSGSSRIKASKLSKICFLKRSKDQNELNN